MIFLDYWFDRKFTLNNLSHIPGSWIDDLYVAQPKSVFAKVWRFIKSKIIYITLFPLLTGINTISNLLTGVFFQAATFIARGEASARYQAKASIAFDQFMKNLFGFIFSPIGLFFTREFSFMLLAKPLTHNKVIAGGKFLINKTTIYNPDDAGSVQQLVKQAIQLNIRDGNKVKIAVRGAGASQGEQFVPAGSESLVMDLKNINTVTVDPEDKTITVGAGATWGQIEEIVAPYGLAIKVRQASNIFSVGGSLSANVHGWAHKDGSIASTVEYIKVVTPQGELVTYYPGDEMFGYIIGGYGMFGIIVEAKLRVTENKLLKEQGQSVPIGEYVNYYKRDDQGAPQHSDTEMHLYRLSLDPNGLLKTGVAVNYVAVPSGSRERIPFDLTLEEPHGTRYQRIMTNVARRFGWMRSLYWKSESKRIIEGKDPAITRVEHMQAPITAMFNNARSDAEWLQEYFVPAENLEPFLNSLGDLLMDNKVVLLNASVRPVVKDEVSKLGYANKGEMFAVVLCFNQKLDDESRLKTRRWIKKANDIVLDNNGTYYLPYQPFATKDQFTKSYPGYKEVLAKKQEIDPNGLLQTGFFNKYFKEEEKLTPFHTVFSNPELSRKFEKFLSNILEEVRPEEFNPLIQDILTYADSEEDIFKELHRRMPEIAPSFITSTRRVLRSLDTIKEDLSNQAFELMNTDATERNKPINGILEVGYPGRFLKPMIQKIGITGKVEVMQEAPAITDLFQSGFPRAHSKAHNLDFNKPKFDHIEDKSFDLVTCFVGLHHFDDAALHEFLFNLNRIIKDDGSFLLMDHDVTDETSHAMASLAHSVFNAVKGASLEEEFHETRNFRSIEQWEEILKMYGFELQPSPRTMIRKDDPSLNTMVRFKKKQLCVLVADAQNENQDIFEDVDIDSPVTPSSAPKPVSINILTKKTHMFSTPQSRKTTESHDAEATHTRRQGQGL
jgi:FAD/FMN-containing dehydrogenase